MRVVVFLLLSCASRPDAASGQGPPTEPSVAGRCSLSAGTHTVKVEVGGQRRTALVRRGSQAGDNAPTLFLWHGFGASAQRILPAVSADEYWEDGLVVVPEGLGRTFEQFGPVSRPGWQTHKGELDDRDLSFFDALMVELEPCLDSSRVYSSGFSNGGFFSNVLGCHRSEILAGVAPVGGGGPFEACSVPMPVMMTHGTLDSTVPFQMAKGSLEVWSKHNACKDVQPAEESCTVLDCAVPTEFCSFKGGHNWPAGTDESIARFLRAQVRSTIH